MFTIVYTPVQGSSNRAPMYDSQRVEGGGLCKLQEVTLPPLCFFSSGRDLIPHPIAGDLHDNIATVRLQAFERKVACQEDLQVRWQFR